MPPSLLYVVKKTFTRFDHAQHFKLVTSIITISSLGLVNGLWIDSNRGRKRLPLSSSFIEETCMGHVLRKPRTVCKSHQDISEVSFPVNISTYRFLFPPKNFVFEHRHILDSEYSLPTPAIGFYQLETCRASDAKSNITSFLTREAHRQRLEYRSNFS